MHWSGPGTFWGVAMGPYFRVMAQCCQLLSAAIEISTVPNLFPEGSRGHQRGETKENHTLNTWSQLSLQSGNPRLKDTDIHRPTDLFQTTRQLSDLTRYGGCMYILGGALT